MKKVKVVLIIMLWLWACNGGFGQVARDTQRIGLDTIRISYYYPVPVSIDSMNGYCYAIYMPSTGGVVRLNDSTTLYQAMFGKVPPLPERYEEMPRIDRFSRGISPRTRITLFANGTYIRQRFINRKWITL